MMQRFLKRSLWILAIAGLATAPGMAATMMHMNLDDMSRNAEKIFRGTVLKISEGEVEAGGAMLPVTTYVLQVDEAFKGEFETVKGIRLVEIRTFGKVPPQTVGNLQRMPVLPQMPALKIGRSYLLFSTRPSSIGLSTTVGLGQGCFNLSGAQFKEMAVNQYDNLGLFSGTAAADVEAGGPVPYQRLAELIRTGLAAHEGGN